MTCDFQQFGVLTSVDSDESVQLLSLETPNGVQSVALKSNNTQAASKGSDQTATTLLEISSHGVRSVVQYMSETLESVDYCHQQLGPAVES